MPFFSQANFQPKRKFRFTVSFTGMPGLEELVFMAKTATKPSYTIESTSHKFLNHEFKFPNIVTWQDVTVTFIDATDPNIGSRFYDALLSTGYLQPSTLDQFRGGVTKVGAHAAIGPVVIRQLDGGGVIGQAVDAGAGGGTVPTQVDPSVIDKWTLHNPWITSLKFGDGLDYGSTELVTIDLTLKYDFAVYERNAGNMLSGL